MPTTIVPPSVASNRTSKPHTSTSSRAGVAADLSPEEGRAGPDVVQARSRESDGFSPIGQAARVGAAVGAA